MIYKYLILFHSTPLFLYFNRKSPICELTSFKCSALFGKLFRCLFCGWTANILSWMVEIEDLSAFMSCYSAVRCASIKGYVLTPSALTSVPEWRSWIVWTKFCKPGWALAMPTMPFYLFDSKKLKYTGNAAFGFSCPRRHEAVNL